MDFYMGGIHIEFCHSNILSHKCSHHLRIQSQHSICCTNLANSNTNNNQTHNFNMNLFMNQNSLFSKNTYFLIDKYHPHKMYNVQKNLHIYYMVFYSRYKYTNSCLCNGLLSTYTFHQIKLNLPNNFYNPRQYNYI